MKNIFRIGITIFLFASCTPAKKIPGTEDGKIEVNLILINDVYEIAPLSQGREGGMARIATLKKKYLAKNPNSFLVLAGDFVSPSVYNGLQYNGKAIRGKQMVEAMNAAGVDMVTFGNHEFDIKEVELQQRIDESKFLWISSNTFHRSNGSIIPFAKTNGNPFPKTYILKVKDADGTEAKIGFIGLCLPFNKADYVNYEDPLQTAKTLYNQLKDSVDAVVAITHQTMEDDIQLAKEIPELAVILGGHEHDQRSQKVGKTYIVKAMANARTAFVVNIGINKVNHKLHVDPDLEKINEHLVADSGTNAVVQKWTDIADSNYSLLGFNAKRIVIATGDNWDGREAVIRQRSTNLTDAIVKSMKAAVPKADVILFNAGSIRVDDKLPSLITEYDIIRTLPYGGGIAAADMKGDVLIKALNNGKLNAGQGGYLLYNKEVKQDKRGIWTLNNIPIDFSKIYHVAMTDFLITGKEAKLEFLNANNPGILRIYPQGKSTSDIRLALIHYLDQINK